MASKTVTNGKIIRTIKKATGKGIASEAFNEMVDNIDYDALASVLQEYARDGHRELGGRHYVDNAPRNTHDLKNNTYAKVTKKNDIQVGYDGRKVIHRGYRYGEFIRHGRDGNSWGGDDFITETINGSSDMIISEMQSAMDDAVEKTNGKFGLLASFSLAGSLLGGMVGTVRRWFT